MRILISTVLIGFSFLGVASCTPQMTKDLWNGKYSIRATNNEWDSAERTYYDKKTSDWMMMFKKNSLLCRDASQNKYPIVNYEQSQLYRTQRTDFYKQCMQDKGTPIFTNQ